MDDAPRITEGADGSASPVPVPIRDETASPPSGGEAKTSGGGRRGIALLLAIAAVVVLVGGVGFAAVRRGSVARDGAEKAIARAERALDQAQLAVEPGSSELSVSQKSQADLAEAKRLYDAGFVVLAQKYRDAEAKAEAANQSATEITDRVTELASQANNSGVQNRTDEAIGLYFDLHKKYPRTPQGAGAIDNAADVLVNGLSGSDYDCLVRIKTFCRDCPADVPESVFSEADRKLRSAAKSALSSQKTVVSVNKSWAKRLRSGKGATFSVWPTTKADTTELNRIIATLSAVKGTEFKKVLVLLRDSSKLGETVGKISRSPVRRTRTTRYFSMSQVKRVASLSNRMGKKLSAADKLLKKL